MNRGLGKEVSEEGKDLKGEERVTGTEFIDEKNGVRVDIKMRVLR